MKNFNLIAGSMLALLLSSCGGVNYHLVRERSHKPPVEERAKHTKDIVAIATVKTEAISLKKDKIATNSLYDAKSENASQASMFSKRSSKTEITVQKPISKLALLTSNSKVLKSKLAVLKSEDSGISKGSNVYYGLLFLALGLLLGILFAPFAYLLVVIGIVFLIVAILNNEF